MNFGMVLFGKAELMLNMHGQPGSQGASLWFYTDQVDALYQLFKSRQMSAAQASLAGEEVIDSSIELGQDIEKDRSYIGSQTPLVTSPPQCSASQPRHEQQQSRRFRNL